MDWLKISLKCLSEDIENLTGLLLLYGWDELVIEDSSLVADLLAEKDGSWDYISEDLLDQEKHLASISFFLPENQGNRDLIDDFFSRLAIYNEQRSNPCCGEISLVNEEKWQDTWKEFFHPLPIGEKLVIKPTWEDYHPLPGQVILEIDP
ncbi:MAG: 50S ribosomal protein L11 methyltransferase, partial [Clostridiales bacterium]